MDIKQIIALAATVVLVGCSTMDKSASCSKNSSCAKMEKKEGSCSKMEKDASCSKK